MNVLCLLCSILCLVSKVDLPATGTLLSLEDTIESLVRDLADDRYDIREHATEELFRIGLPALSALEKAATSSDPEVRLRSRTILADIRLGIRPSWPSDMILLVRHYESMDRNERRRALYGLFEGLKEEAVMFFLTRLATEDSDEGQEVLRCLQRLDSEEAANLTIQFLKKPSNELQSQALAWAYSRLGNWLRALQILAEADVSSDLGNSVVKKAVEALLAKLKDEEYEEVAQSAAIHAKAVPEDARFLYIQAVALAFLQKGEEAEALRKQAQAMAPEKEAPHYIAGDMLEDMGQPNIAALEWKLILKIPPHDTVYDINAHLRLGPIYAQYDIFDEAADHIQKALDLYREAKENGKGMGMIGGDEESLEREIREYRQKAKGTTIEGELENDNNEETLEVEIKIEVKDDKLNELCRELENVSTTVNLNFEPRDLKLFDKAPVKLRYDSEESTIEFLLKEDSFEKVVVPRVDGDKMRVAIHPVDCYYIYEIDTATGEARKLLRYEKDYTLRLTPSARIASYKNVKVQINGTHYNWKALLAGVSFDYLPVTLEISMQAVTPTGQHRSLQYSLPIKEPDLAPQDDSVEQQKDPDHTFSIDVGK